MFNIYIYDYCFKRGYKKTARELLQEADIPHDSKPPINARQGLLFEWWSVFWVLFTAKANGHGSDDAMVYTHHQANQAMQRQLQQQRMQPPTQASLPGAPVGQPGGPQQPPAQRMMNGPIGQRLGAPFQINGPISNGVTSGSLQPGQIAPAPSSFPNMGGPGPQPNGIPGSGHPQTPGSAPAQIFPSLMPNQRPIGAAGGPQQSPQPPQPLQQQRQNGPFQSSPTMVNSPQANVPSTPQQQPQQPQQQPPQHHTQPPPMGQLGAPGPSPHMQHLNRSMPPPQGLNPLNPGVQQPGNTPNSSFAQLGRPPSRTNTPGGQSSMLHPSPSLSARQPPGNAMVQSNQDIELRHIPTSIFLMLRQELGLGDRDISQMTPAEKSRLILAHRQRRPKPDGTGPAAGLQPPNPVHIRGLQQQQQQQQRLKRSSTTPEEQHEGARTDSSPPQKRQRPSPEQPPMQGIGYPPQQSQQQPGPSSGPQTSVPMPGQNPLMMVRGTTQIGGAMGGGMPQGGQPPMGNPMNLNLGHPPLGGPQLGGVSLNPHIHPGQPGLINQQQMQWQYRQQMQALKGQMPQGMNPTIPGPANNSASNSTDPPMHPGGPGGPGGPQFNRLPPQNKPLGMMPPPSPAQNGANKDQGVSKDGKMDDASRNTGGNAGQTPNASGTAPPTPAPGAPTNQGSTPATNGGPNVAPSPSSILGLPLNSGPMVNQQSVLAETLFPPDFMQHLSNSLDDFNPGIFPADNDINFERDFGQWFNGDDVHLDMK